MRTLFNEIKWALQRIYRGYDDRLFWGISSYIDPMIIAALDFYMKDGCGYPLPYKNFSEWKKKLKSIRDGLAVDLDGEPYSHKLFEKRAAKRKKAIKDLADNYDHLWW